MFTFTPLLGAQSESTASQSLVELDGGVKVLVDVGWDEAFDNEKLAALTQHVSTLSLVLLTHPTLDHLGAYAHCCKHIPYFARLPVYATTPVINLGRTLLADVYASSPSAASLVPNSSFPSTAASPTSSSSSSLLLPAPTADEIASYFDQIHPLKYSQPHQPIPSPLSPPLGNLTITAYSAGHTPGGTIWHIQHGLESIVYAADWNLARENLLSGAAWLGGGSEIIEPLLRPTALVCSSRGVDKTDVLPQKKRDELLISLIRETIVQGGKVLIPTDSSARVLELAFLLNHTWQENINGPHADTYRHARIYMATRSSTSTVRQLQGMLEWLNDTIIRDAEAAMGQEKGDDKKVPNLLDWKYVKQIERKSQFDRALRRSQPCIMLASDAALEWGYSRQALESLAADSRNLVILTENLNKASPSTLAKQLASCWRDRLGEASESAGAKVVAANGHSFSFREGVISELSNEEDALYQQYIARQRHLHSNLQGDNTTNDAAATEIADEQAEESSDDEDEDDDSQQQGRALNASAQITQSNKRRVGLSDEELGINVLLRSKTVHDFDVRNKRGREKMFPFVAHRSKADDFGDIIKPEDFLRAEERDDVEGVDTRAGEKQPAAPGQKRKWDDVANTKEAKSKKPAKEQNKRAKVEREPDDIDALIARATGEGVSSANGANSEGSESDSEYEPEESNAASKPHKITFNQRSIEVHCRVAQIDFSGLHEKRDLQMIIPRVRPRKLILIAGSISETQTLAGECRRLLAGEEGESDVLTPIVGELVDASVDTNAWTLKLSRQLVKKLIWQNVRGLGVVALTGRLDVEALENDAEDESAKKRLKLVKAEERAENAIPSIPVLDLIGTNMQQRATQPVHVGDLRLADLRRLLQGLGHTAEFRGEGTLLIDSTVVVRKSATGRIEIEAGAGGVQQPHFRTRDNEGTFFAVRKAIYNGLAVVSGV